MKSLKSSIMEVCIVFVCSLSILISFITYRIYTFAMFDRYQKELKSVLDYVEVYIDRDDMAECVRTNQESDVYQICQDMFDTFVDYFTDVHYLYILRPDLSTDPVQMLAVCSGNTSYEKQYVPENVLRLGDSDTDWYTEATIRKFWDIQNGDQDVYFRNASSWGVDYTLARPLITSSGEHFAVLCADISIIDINQAVYQNIMWNVMFLLLLCLGFTVFLLLWLQRNVTAPLNMLQKSVTDFASSSNDNRDPDKLYQPPELKVKNEISALSDEITKLSMSMRNYILDLISAERITKALRERVTDFHSPVYQDILSRVKREDSYTRDMQRLQNDIDRGVVEFAILLLDFNGFEQIRDSFGSQNADRFVAGGCQMICQTYKHSPVYRLSENTFAVILLGKDYRDKASLLTQISDNFLACAHNEMTAPWERYSAITGLGIYQDGDTAEDVHHRAEQQMLGAKSGIKSVFRDT